MNEQHESGRDDRDPDPFSLTAAAKRLDYLGRWLFLFAAAVGVIFASLLGVGLFELTDGGSVIVALSFVVLAATLAAATVAIAPVIIFGADAQSDAARRVRRRRRMLVLGGVFFAIAIALAGIGAAAPAINVPEPLLAGIDVDEGDETSDASPKDRDGDGVGNDDDNCPTQPNSDQSNGDGDGVGDACDLFKFTSSVKAYAPLVWLHRKEQFFPMTTDRFIQQSKLHFAGRERRGEFVPVSSPDPKKLANGGYCLKPQAVQTCRTEDIRSSELTRPFHSHPERRAKLKEGFALDVNDRSRCGDHEFLTRLHRIKCTFGRAPVFFDYSPRHWVAYWFFYGYSKPLFNRIGHEGDWERVVVRLDEATERPTFVAYYQHKGPPEIYEWKAVTQQIGARQRPIVYSGLGTHASWPTPGITGIDRRNAGHPWETWRDLRPLRQETWFGYGGAWGAAKGRSDFTGPLGPSKWKHSAPCEWSPPDACL